jgi:type I restriction enzyme M protein
VWFYDMKYDGFTMDDKRNPTTENDIPDLLKRWADRDPDKGRKRTDPSFFVPRDEIVGSGYDLSVNRYQEAAPEIVEEDPPMLILERLGALDKQIAAGLDELREALQ